jgi:hypothetical protein
VHPDPSRNGELCTQAAASTWSRHQSLDLQPHPDPSRSGELCTQDAASTWSRRQKRKGAAPSATKTIKKKKLTVHERMKALGCSGVGYLRISCARELGSSAGSKEDMVERLELARSMAA